MVKERIQRVLGENARAGSKTERAGQILPSLQQIQREFGYIPTEAIPEVAAFAGVPESHVYGVATFYAHFKFTPSGRHPITVCCGTACHVRGSAKLVTDVQNRLGIAPGETTPDKNFTLETTACFGSCALAPVIVVDGKVRGRMNRSRILKSIDMLEAADKA